jgi:hypothetical protein
VIGHRRLRAEALEPAVARVREPDRAVALHDHVVGRVERPAVQVRGERLAVPGDRGRPRERALLADDEAAVEIERHAVGDVRVLADRLDAIGLEREVAAVQREAPDGHHRMRAARPGEGREVEGVLVRDVDRALVGIGRDDLDQAGRTHCG